MGNRDVFIKKAKERLGETKLNNQGEIMWIEEYNGANDIIVRFKLMNYVTKSTYNSFAKGGIKNPYTKSMFGRGFLGEGKYKGDRNGGYINKRYDAWASMFKRCYDGKAKAYEDCEVGEYFLKFQNFAKWYDDNYYTAFNRRMEIDKDILNKGNKIYSPENCIIVPDRINSLFTTRFRDRGKHNLPLGVSIVNNVNNTIRKNMYQAICSNINNKNKSQGCYDTPEKAFYEGYKPFKEYTIKQVADQYKPQIPLALHTAMYNWEVEIDD